MTIGLHNNDFKAEVPDSFKPSRTRVDKLLFGSSQHFAEIKRISGTHLLPI